MNKTNKVLTIKNKKDMTNSVKDVKEALRAALNILEDYDESDACVIELDDNCGGSYDADINDFVVTSFDDGFVFIRNF